MKKQIITLALCLFALSDIMAQAFLNDVMEVSERRRYSAYTSKDDPVRVANYYYKCGFTLATGEHGLIAEGNPGYAVFDLNGEYEKMNFVVGTSNQQGGIDGSVVLLVTGDGETILDEVIKNPDAPREFTLDIKGVNKLKFSLLHGDTDLAFGNVRVYKAGEELLPPENQFANVPDGKIRLVENLDYYYRGSYAARIDKNAELKVYTNTVNSISITRKEYEYGIQFDEIQQLIGNSVGRVYFWLNKRYDKVSFIVGPRDNQSSLSTAWLTVKADDKIVYERLIRQTDLSEQVVIDVKGVNQLSFHAIDEDHEFDGQIVYGVVDIYAYPEGDTTVPKAGIANPSKEWISKLPDVCKLVSKIPPYSVRGVAKHQNTYFDGATKHYHFSMGGEQFSEGFILTTGTTFFDDNVNAFAYFDIAGEFDWVTFTAGCLTKHRVLDDDRIRVYADNKCILDTVIHATWPNQHFKLPLNKCRVLRFEKPGTGQSKQVYFGIGDVVLYRGEVVPNKLFVHEKPECPETVDLIDLCKNPYFHFVGRYLSTLTNFDFNDCFKNGGSQKEYFQMKDGTRIYKGIMLETNVPTGLEDMTFSRALCLMFTPTYVAGMDLALCDDDGHQSSCAAFNPYKEYETCTFTVANKSVYVDPFVEMWGDKKADPVTLYVIADQHQVADIELTDDMKPTTFTVPINKCEQLMFWLKCGAVRSGQYVIYDITLDKKPLKDTKIVTNKTDVKPEVVEKAAVETVVAEAVETAVSENVEPEKVETITIIEEEVEEQQPEVKQQPEAKPEPKAEPKVVEIISDYQHNKVKNNLSAWDASKKSGNKQVDKYLEDITEMLAKTNEMIAHTDKNLKISKAYFKGSDGKVYKAISIIGTDGSKQSISKLVARNNEIIEMKKAVNSLYNNANTDFTAASGEISKLGDKSNEFYNIILQGGEIMSQCQGKANDAAAATEKDNKKLQKMKDSTISIDGIKSTDKVLLMQLSNKETLPDGYNLVNIKYLKVE